MTTLNKTTLNTTTQRVITSDVVHPEDEAATPEEAVVKDAVLTTQRATLQPSVTICGGPYPHEGGRSKCPAYNADCHQCGIVGHYAHKYRGGAPPSRIENSNRGRGCSNSRGNRGGERHDVHNVEHGDEQSAEAPMSQLTPAKSPQRQNIHTLDDEENYIFTISTTK